jgi:uncharacterized protein DUF1360
VSGLQFVVQALAAYRLTLLLQVDDLPPLPDLRERLYRLQAGADERTVRGRLVKEFAYMINCPWCLGFWVSVGVLTANALFPALWRPLATSLALSAVVGHMRTKLD